MNVGGWKIETLETGTFALDGGAMFGVVPRPLWSRAFPPDSEGRIRLLARCLLLTHEDGRVVLVDSGIGRRWLGRARETYAIEQGRSVAEVLALRGVAPEDITEVIATHLHFDHAGGLVETGPDHKLRPTFPRARVHVQAEHLAWARRPSIKDRASFRPADFVPLEEAAVLEVHEGPGEILPGVTVRLSHGHTPAMQVVLITTEETGVVFASDLIPTLAHIRLPWIMAYDNQPLLLVEEKAALLDEAGERGWIIVSDHDPETAAFTLRRDQGQLVPKPYPI